MGHSTSTCRRLVSVSSVGTAQQQMIKWHINCRCHGVQPCSLIASEVRRFLCCTIEISVATVGTTRGPYHCTFYSALVILVVCVREQRYYSCSPP